MCLVIYYHGKNVCFNLYTSTSLCLELKIFPAWTFLRKPLMKWKLRKPHPHCRRTGHRCSRHWESRENSGPAIRAGLSYAETGTRMHDIFQCCGSRILYLLDLWVFSGSHTHIFESLMTIFWVKNSIILCKLTENFSSPQKIILNICSHKKR